MTTFAIGDTRGAVYDFAAAGDTLPMHDHADEDSHTMIVTVGRVLLRVEQIDGTVMETEHGAGAFVDTHSGFPHEIVALADGARTIHHVKKYREK
jgi:quercetin dioxygenase-like cupin family protein